MKICQTNVISRINQRRFSPMDIGYKCKYPLDVLSNFTKTNIQYDGVQINSIEGFLQSLKTPDIDKQKKICSLVGYSAKKQGNKLKKKKIFDNEHLYWQGKMFLRNSQEYQEMLKAVFTIKYKNDIKFRNALNKTGEHKLTHSIGKNDPKQTILTIDEFVNLLINLRNTEPVAFKDRVLLAFERMYNNLIKIINFK